MHDTKLPTLKGKGFATSLVHADHQMLHLSVAKKLLCLDMQTWHMTKSRGLTLQE